ncbi:MAG: 2-oxoacid:acceptor oxidoreductase family protein [Deferrisomatales bacterium]|nr:2-oxoacid:acceptor oxidoreductase family protein [Deferrisomatales bacterium]
MIARTKPKATKRIEIRLAGSGGQGLITAGVILAEAAALHEGRNAVQTQSYGPEARGGASKAEVIISDGPIHFPKAQRLDVLLAMTQEASDLYYHDLKYEGILLIDSDLVTSPPTSAALGVPITRMVRDELGRELFANIAALGVLVGATGVVGEKALQAALLARVPKGTEAVNKKAFALGLKAGRAAARVEDAGTEFAED